MKRIARTLACAGVLVSCLTSGTAGLAQPDSGRLRPYRAVYGLFDGDARIGESVYSLTYDLADGHYVFESRSELRGFLRLISPRPVIERSEFRLIEGGVRPLAYTYRDGTRRGRRNLELQFDWDAMRVLVTRADQTTELPMPPQPLDRASMRIALALALADSKRSGRFEVADPDVFRTYEFASQGTETTDTPLGVLDVQRVSQRRDGSERSTVVLAAAELDYHAVRIEQHRPNRDPVAFALESFEWITTDSPENRPR